ncbi:hypothetical protein FBZ98_108230 [Rhizobium sp. ERR 922]|nr:MULTISPECIES: hypothetical protein [Rhizobium]TWB10947.1 hypothetical protein FBZ99_110167 [Rhizobium sp. ERR1071]TWB48611.1 hypothetical protein FBZ98_108230 [Rhizobium sp. ERR 922]TWB90332.1 hypothetical protein FBZ97_109230 [Rhizobium sp. ERR 942]GES41524.1 hypothetical protein RsS62_07760 [Rhizobium dioscoreae]
MERFRHLIGGSLSPKQVATLQKVLDNVTSQPWFDNSEHCRNALAGRLTFLIKIGIENTAHLQTIGVCWAVNDFNRDVMKTNRRKPAEMIGIGKAEQLRLEDYR